MIARHMYDISCWCDVIMSCGRPLLEVASSCELSPLSSLTAQEGSTLVLGRFDQIGTAGMAAAAASNAIEIADGKHPDHVILHDFWCAARTVSPTCFFVVCLASLHGMQMSQ